MRYLFSVFILFLSMNSFAASNAVCEFTEGRTTGVVRFFTHDFSMLVCPSDASSDCEYVLNSSHFPTIDERVEIDKCRVQIQETVSSGVFFNFECPPDVFAPRYLNLTAHGRLSYENAYLHFQHYDPKKNGIDEKNYQLHNCKLY